ncbi:MAG: Cu(I)-responsive transcriptional regulator [Alphaproteobacteria bacterium]|nr:Cu(I)-responsive transcriptional regulator [Rhodobiaceae bacterium]MBO6544250.1 Cu(I)-responsive transcriptional regulator [Alphaproteobacteria bacterium]MBO6627636.1 Cu(I)-responsive transcriptional regulator [Alphaproteobacteria bacterium]MDF1627745.1 Cu(I)-responsive transcriptional regulator [Parvibaculaceae bacterium]
MKIGTVAEQTGVSAKTIRYYEEIGLLEAPPRQENGYRAYTDDDVRFLDFINRARRLGFSVAECKDLLTLYRDKSRASADVKALALAHVAEIDQKLRELQSIRHTLATLAHKCHGDDRPDCPILEELSNTPGKGK